MPDSKKAIYAIERCICHVPDACRDCPYDAGHPYNECIEMLLKDVLELLKEQEKIVLCKDCKHFKDNRCLNDDVHYSIDDCGCQPTFYVTDDWFCAEGERR